MTLARIILNNARQRSLSTVLTSLSVAVGVALIIAILTIKIIAQERFHLGYSGFDLVVGAKGSPLQLVLNVVYHLDVSPGNVSFSLYEKLQKDPRVKWVTPFSMGDSYEGFRIVGTTDTFLKNFQPHPNQSLELASGRFFKFEEADLRKAIQEAIERGKTPIPSKKVEQDTARYFEAVLGSIAAEETGLKVGDTFVATHGLQQTAEGSEHKESPWRVAGILQPTGTPVDRAIYINLDSFYRIEGHVIEKPKPLGTSSREKETKEEKSTPEEAGRISALALKLYSPLALQNLSKQINETENAQATIPAQEIRKLLMIVGNVDRILLLQAALIVVVAAIGIGLAMFNSMNDRRRDIAVMRALGAKRSTIFSIVVGEAILITGIGGMAGLLLGHGVIWSMAPVIQTAIGFSIPSWSFHGFEVIILVGALFMGIFAGIGPAISAYRTDVATNLTPHS